MPKLPVREKLRSFGRYRPKAILICLATAAITLILSLGVSALIQVEAEVGSTSKTTPLPTSPSSSSNPSPVVSTVVVSSQADKKAQQQQQLLARLGQEYPEVARCNAMSIEEIAALQKVSVEDLKLLQTKSAIDPHLACLYTPTNLQKAIGKLYNPSAPKAARIDGAIEWRSKRKESANGTIPADGLDKALGHITTMPKVGTSGTGTNNVPSVAGISPGSWQWLGPDNIGGRTRTLVIHPTQPMTMWLGSAGGGVWKTQNSGASWKPVTDKMPNLSVSTLLLDPVNPNIIYAGTGEGFFNADSITGNGMYKSYDGGTTWQKLAFTGNNPDFYFVNRLAVGSSAGSRSGSYHFLAATSTGVFRSTNNGDHWTKVLTPTSTVATKGIVDLKAHPKDRYKVVAGGYYGYAAYSSDGGTTWQTATVGWATGSSQANLRVELAFAPSDSNIVYASVNQNGGEIWKSTDSGKSYSLVHTGSGYLATIGWYANTIWVDPTNSDKLVVGGLDLWRGEYGISGLQLTQISEWGRAPKSAHADHHYIVHDPNFDGKDNTVVYFLNDGGIYRAKDVYNVNIVDGWEALNNGLGITQFYGAAGDQMSDIIAGGTQDNGSLRTQYGRSIGTQPNRNWVMYLSGDGGYSAIQNEGNLTHLYGEYIHLKLHRHTANSGQIAQYIYQGISEAGNEQQSNFIAPFIIDPETQSLLAGGTRLWRSSNPTATIPSWSVIKSASGSSNCKTDNSCISAITAANGEAADSIWVGHNNGALYYTPDGDVANPQWTKISSASLPKRYISRIAIPDYNPDTIYVSYGGFEPDNLWRSTDGGVTWQDVTGSGATGLPNVPIYSLAIHPQNSNWLYVGTEVGIFASEDGGSSWKVNPNDGPLSVPVDDLQWMNRVSSLDHPQLIAATHGRGVYKAVIPVPCQDQC
jgi:photosystem II stability/assembly factor-like uncharacterized protein